MKKPTKKQLEILLISAPPPFGQKLTYKEISKVLGISEKTIKDRMNRFRKSFPEVYKRFWGIRKDYTKNKFKCKHPQSLDGLVEYIFKKFNFDYLSDAFDFITRNYKEKF